MNTLTRLVLGVLLFTAVPIGSAQAAAFPGDPAIAISGLINTCQRCLFQNPTEQAVLKFNLTNTSTVSVNITQLAVHFSGTATNTDIGTALWYDDPHSALIGQASFDLTKTATINGASLLLIPAGEMREVTIYVTVLPGAVLNNTAKFSVVAGDIQYTGTINTDVVGKLPFVGNILSICSNPVIVGPASITVLSPNGGEVFTRGGSYGIGWKTINEPLGAYVRNIELYKGGVLIKNIDEDLQAVPRIPVGGKYKTSQIVRFIVPASLTPGTDYTIRVVLYQGPTTGFSPVTSDFSNAPFEIN